MSPDNGPNHNIGEFAASTLADTGEPGLDQTVCWSYTGGYVLGTLNPKAEIDLNIQWLISIRHRFHDLWIAAEEANSQIDALRWRFFDLVWGPRIGAIAIFGSIALAWLYAYLASR